MISIDSFLQKLFISGVLLARDGRIVEVSEGWKQFAKQGGLAMAGYGIGENYLRHCVFPDQLSANILQGLQRVLERKLDVFSTLYPCDTPEQRKWFLLVALAAEQGPEIAAAVLHIDVTFLLRQQNDISASMLGFGPGALDPAMETLTSVVRRTIAETLSRNGHRNKESELEPADRKRISSLTAHQLGILRDVGRGATNAEIAMARNISLSSAKTQTAGVIRKLGFKNRTQAALFAARVGLNEA